MFKLLLIPILLITAISAQADDSVVDKIIAIQKMNNDWKPSIVEISDEITDRDGKPEYIMTVSAKSSANGYMIEKAQEDGKDVDADNKDALELIKQEEEFIAGTDFNEEDVTVNSTRYLGREQCGETICEKYRFLIHAETVSFKIVFLLRKDDLLPMSYTLTALMPFKNEGAYVTSFTREVKFNDDINRWYPVSKVERSEFEIKKFMLTWDGINTTKVTYKDYQTGKVQ